MVYLLALRLARLYRVSGAQVFSFGGNASLGASGAQFLISLDFAENRRIVDLL
jgi:hypothetical protein